MIKKRLYAIRIGVLCLFLSIGASAYAQKDSVDKAELIDQVNLPLERYLYLGTGFSAVKLHDDHVSPLNYLGATFDLHLGNYKRKGFSIREFGLSGGLATLSPKEDNREIDPTGQYYRVDLMYRRLWHIKPVFDRATQWYLGGKVLSRSEIRLNPQLDGSFITFLFANGVHFSSALERDFDLFGKNWRVYGILDLPFLNHTIRPSYLNIYDFVNPEFDWLKERIDDSNIRSIFSYSNINTTLGLQYPIRGGNVLQLQYNWDFYRIDSRLPASNATHTVRFSFFFNY
jgi:hypothetical protein